MRCFTIRQVREGQPLLVSRGCVQFIGTNALTCQWAANDQTTQSCELCEENNCNSSAMHFIKLATIVTALFIAIMRLL